MNRHVNAISGRLSLRQPQRDSLEILARVADIAQLGKGADVATVLEVIRSEYPNVQDFERDFPSLCFALATGVGKTRLMGAFVTYLHLAKGIRHFFVLAPNLTIYNKLIADFTPNTPKYVFKGIAEFALTPPVIITGDNYESGKGVRDEFAKQRRLNFDGNDPIHINIFNISKINSEVRGGAAPRIKRLSEYIGESYFEYLAGLEDLVLIMDESHRYRASAGVKAINELKPILGLELTATPQVEGTGGRPTFFKNVIFDYPLSRALADGFVKQPAVATRENFNPREYNEAQLELIKLQDGVRVHEAVKVELEVFARQNSLPVVKPFMLIVARDITHAADLVARISGDEFFEGRYKGKVIQVDSSKTGAAEDEMVERLLAVESPAEPTEIVVHVNMLKEGWDVTNLYTIVPLRAANSRTLVEQSIGRGLRLPYGKRVGIPVVDTLTIVAHDRFQEIVDEANKPDSAIRLERVYIGKDIAEEQQKAVVVSPILTQPSDIAGGPVREKTDAEKSVVKATLEAIKKLESLPTSKALQNEEVKKQIVEEVRAKAPPVQPTLPGATVETPNVEALVEETVRSYVARTIDVPRIIVVPTGDVSSGFNDFDLDVSNINYPPMSHDILLKMLDTGALRKLEAVEGGEEERLDNYLVRALIDFDDICYDEHADLLYKLAGQVVDRLRSYLSKDEDVRNVLIYHQRTLANLIHAQMQAHHWEKSTAYEAKVTKGFKTFSESVFKAPAGEVPRDFRIPIDDKQNIRKMLFIGYTKCIYPIQKFDSDSERRFSAILEADPDVVKWFKPARGDFHIYYQADTPYEPDFVVETKTGKFICEPKAANQMDDEIVRAKAKAAVQWCEHASAHEKEIGGKPWLYILIPHDAIKDNLTVEGMIGMFGRG